MKPRGVEAVCMKDGDIVTDIWTLHNFKIAELLKEIW